LTEWLHRSLQGIQVPGDEARQVSQGSIEQYMDTLNFEVPMLQITCANLDPAALTQMFGQLMQAEHLRRVQAGGDLVSQVIASGRYKTRLFEQAWVIRGRVPAKQDGRAIARFNQHSIAILLIEI